MAKRSNKKMTITAGEVKGRIPESIQARNLVSMSRLPALKGKEANTPRRREGKAECDRRAW